MPLVDGISRRQLQQLALKALLDADTMAGDRVYLPRDWPTTTDRFPMLLAATPSDRKTSLGRGILQFNTTIQLVITGRVAASTEEDVRDLLDAFSAQIEEAVFFAPELSRNIQQFSAVDTTTTIGAVSRQQVGEIGMTFDCEVYQVFEPRGVPLVGVNAAIGVGTSTIESQVTFPLPPQSPPAGVR